MVSQGQWAIFSSLWSLLTEGKPQVSQFLLGEVESMGNSLTEALGLNSEDKQMSREKVAHTVEQLIEFNCRFQGLLLAVKYDMAITKSVDTGLQTVISRHHKFIHCLVIYMDLELKREEPSISKLEQAIKLFSYLHSRDAFLKLYSRHFSARLLSNITRRNPLEH